MRLLAWSVLLASIAPQLDWPIPLDIVALVTTVPPAHLNQMLSFARWVIIAFRDLPSLLLAPQALTATNWVWHRSALVFDALLDMSVLLVV